MMKAVVALLALAALACAQTPAVPKGGNIDADDFEHSYALSGQVQMFWDESDATNIVACVEGQGTGYVTIGWNSVSDVIMGVVPTGTGTVAVVDADGHRPRPTAQAQMSFPGKPGSQSGVSGGWMTLCFERPWAGGADNTDIIHDGSQNMNIKFAVSNAQPTNNQLAGLDNQGHGGDGTKGVNLQDPANPISGGGAGNNNGDTSGAGAGSTTTIILVIAGVGVAAAGVWWYQKNQAGGPGGPGGMSKDRSYGGPPPGPGYGGPPPGPGYGGPPPGPGYGGPPPNYSSGGYGGPGTYGSGHSSGSRSRSRSGGSGGGRSRGSRGDRSRGSSGGRSNGSRGSRGRASNR